MHDQVFVFQQKQARVVVAEALVYGTDDSFEYFVRVLGGQSELGDLVDDREMGVPLPFSFQKTGDFFVGLSESGFCKDLFADVGDDGEAADVPLLAIIERCAGHPDRDEASALVSDARRVAGGFPPSPPLKLAADVTFAFLRVEREDVASHDFAARIPCHPLHFMVKGGDRFEVVHRGKPLVHRVQKGLESILIEPEDLPLAPFKNANFLVLLLVRELSQPDQHFVKQRRRLCHLVTRPVRLIGAVEILEDDLLEGEVESAGRVGGETLVYTLSNGAAQDQVVVRVAELGDRGFQHADQDITRRPLFLHVFPDLQVDGFLYPFLPRRDQDIRPRGQVARDFGQGCCVCGVCGRHGLGLGSGHQVESQYNGSCNTMGNVSPLCTGINHDLTRFAHLAFGQGVA